MTATIEELRYRRGYRDGRDGLSPTDATEEYWAGYMKGRADKAAVDARKVRDQ